MVRLLHCADLHFKKSALDDIRRCTEHLLNQASQRNIDLAVVAGDLFDGQVYLEEQVVREAIGFVMSLSHHCPVVILKGTQSHDRESLHVFRTILTCEKVYVADSPCQATIFIGLHGSTINPLSQKPTSTKPFNALISFVPPFTPTPGKETPTEDTTLFKRFGDAADSLPDTPHILVGHFTVRGAKVSASQRMIGYDQEVSAEQIFDAVPDLVCLGHIHYPQKIGSCIFYSGSLYRTDFGEDEDKGFWIHDVDANGLQDSEFITVPARKKVVVDIDLTESMDLPELDPSDYSECDVRLNMTFRDEQAHMIDMEKIRSLFGRPHSLRIDTRRVRDDAVRWEGIQKARTLREKLTGWAESLDGHGNVPESVLEKADRLENMDEEKVLKEVSESLEG